MRSLRQGSLWLRGWPWWTGWFCYRPRLPSQGWGCSPNLFTCHGECYSGSSWRLPRMPLIRLNFVPSLTTSRMCHPQIGKCFNFESDWGARPGHRPTTVRLFGHCHGTILSVAYSQWAQHAHRSLYSRTHPWVRWARRWGAVGSGWGGGPGGLIGDISFIIYYLMQKIISRSHEEGEP